MNSTTTAFQAMQSRRVVLQGEWDLERKAELKALLDTVPPDRPLTIDLQKVTYGDSTFLSALALLARRFQGMPVTLLGPCGPLKRLLTMSRLDHIFNVVDVE